MKPTSSNRNTRSRAPKGTPGVLLLLLLHASGAGLQAQELPEPPTQALTVRALGLSYHLRKSDNARLFPNRLDPDGRWVANYGLIIGYERFLNQRGTLSLRLQQSLYADCAASLGGFTHFGFRGRIFEAGRHSLIGGFGPTLVYRQDWNRLDGYRDDGYFNRHGTWQYRFYWYAGEFEYYYRLQPHTQIGLTLVPGLPELLLIGVGYRSLF